MTPEEIQARWADLRNPSVTSDLEAVEAETGSGVWVARDHINRLHLLVQVPAGLTLDLPGTHGLGISIARHQVHDRTPATYVDMVCLDQAVLTTFAAVAAEIVNWTVAADLAERRGHIIAVLTEWRWFWGVDPSRLTAANAVGLFGELWFLLRWAGVSAASVQAWDASDGARHDFQWADRSVEVKATARAGPVVHTIQHLEQLDDPETGRLYLYSLRIARDALATNTLASLVDAANAALAGQAEVRSQLQAKLGQRGYTPAQRQQVAVAYRVIEEVLYRVDDQFPRLTRASFADGMPSGVVGVSYQLDMSACDKWRIGNEPTAWAKG